MIRGWHSAATETTCMDASGMCCPLLQCLVSALPRPLSRLLAIQLLSLTVTFDDNDESKQVHLYQEEYKFMSEEGAGGWHMHMRLQFLHACTAAARLALLLVLAHRHYMTVRYALLTLVACR